MFLTGVKPQRGSEPFLYPLETDRLSLPVLRRCFPEELQAISIFVRLWLSLLRQPDYICSVLQSNCALTTAWWLRGAFWRTANLIWPVRRAACLKQTYIFLFQPGTALNAWEKGKGYCLRTWMSATSRSTSAADCGLIPLSCCPHQPWLMVALCCRAPLGVDLTAEVKAAAIKLPAVRMKILRWQTVGFILRNKTPWLQLFINTFVFIYLLI